MTCICHPAHRCGRCDEPVDAWREFSANWQRLWLGIAQAMERERQVEWSEPHE